MSSVTRCTETLLQLQQTLSAALAEADSDLSTLSVSLDSDFVWETLDGLAADAQAQLLLEFQAWLNDAVTMLQSERDAVTTALEKIQLAKKVTASYHNVQKG